MKGLIKNIGFILIILSTIFLGVSVLNNTATNAILATCGIVIVVGLLLYIILNRIVEDK